MYKIIKKDAVLGIVSNLTWVCMQENGCYGLTVEDNAQGIALNGTVYHVNGHPKLDGAETVSVEEVDDGVYASSLTALLTDPNDLRNSEQFRKAVQMFAKALTKTLRWRLQPSTTPIRSVMPMLLVIISPTV